MATRPRDDYPRGETHVSTIPIYIQVQPRLYMWLYIYIYIRSWTCQTDGQNAHAYTQARPPKKCHADVLPNTMLKNIIVGARASPRAPMVCANKLLCAAAEWTCGPQVRWTKKTCVPQRHIYGVWNFHLKIIFWNISNGYKIKKK